MRVALDTNLLIYAEGVNDAERRSRALNFIDSLDAHELVVPIQVLGELFFVLRRKGGFTPANATRVIRRWLGIASTVPSDADAVLTAVDLVETHRISFWDAVVLAAASAGGCQVLYSEDFQDGFTWRGVTIRNPFALA